VKFYVCELKLALFLWGGIAYQQIILSVTTIGITSFCLHLLILILLLEPSARSSLMRKSVNVIRQRKSEISKTQLRRIKTENWCFPDLYFESIASDPAVLTLRSSDFMLIPSIEGNYSVRFFDLW
jgi:hypothetical protein